MKQYIDRKIDEMQKNILKEIAVMLEKQKAEILSQHVQIQ